ncbi:MAG TPA: hypothetical protein VN963_11045 [bacterium]|nr:hypothetical protein [bacterium]
MKTVSNQNPKQLHQKINALTKDRKLANLSQNDTNPLFELAHISLDPKKIKLDQRTTPRKPW